ncbi:8-oxo-dGTP diphosphatase [Breznakibacter xylanolyticus]|uniref:8-oxo-dGTP diphosphatase n=1 Tax=Breznakibacter xylanolyticus TaxID=990 RepID=A0A2W7MVL3_9BACT|nr:NUDIX hydrolase [Breznakibacter xylanolyticus]PZX11870.1 8-oxo-dGTP diphosphatase [Breznakibacter xylanolyticus]
MSYTYDYPRPAVTADALVLAGDKAHLHILLIQRGHDPFAGRWALPGGFVDMDEDLDASAERELQEETGLQLTGLTQLHTFGAVGRDPRHRTITVAYYVFIDAPLPVKGMDDASDARWFPINQLPPLAFDHDRIIQTAMDKLGLLECRSLGV